MRVAWSQPSLNPPLLCARGRSTDSPAPSQRRPAGELAPGQLDAIRKEKPRRSGASGPLLRLTRRSLLKFPAYVGTLPDLRKSSFPAGWTPLRSGLLSAPSPRSPARSCSFEFMSREERSSPSRALPRSPCRCRLGGNRRGQLIGARRERGETRLGATRLTPEAARTCEGCEGQARRVGGHRATSLSGHRDGSM